MELVVRKSGLMDDEESVYKGVHIMIDSETGSILLPLNWQILALQCRTPNSRLSIYL